MVREIGEMKLKEETEGDTKGSKVAQEVARQKHTKTKGLAISG